MLKFKKYVTRKQCENSKIAQFLGKQAGCVNFYNHNPKSNEYVLIKDTQIKK